MPACRRHPPSRPPRAARGIALPMALVILTLLALMGTMALRSTTVSERVAGNARDRDKAFQAAEAAVQACLDQFEAGAYPAARLLTPPVNAGAQEHWQVEANWTDAGSQSVTLGVNPGLAQPPRCMVEVLNATAGSVRVTARATGASPDTIVILQATASRE